MKKIGITAMLLLITVLLFAYHSTSVVAFAETNEFANMTAKSVILIHPDSNEVLYAKNEHLKMQVASICKLMTTLLTLEQIKKGALTLDDAFIASSYAASMESSQAFLDDGSSYTVKDLLKSVIVASANDSAVALAEGISGSESGFVQKMNQRAKELNMTDTCYANATGLPAPQSYSSAADTAILLHQVSQYDTFNQDSKIWMDNFTHPSGRVTELVNTNRLIKYYTPTINGKTGFTDEAGYCLASTAQQNGLKLVAVTLNCSGASERFKENMQLFNYGFANFENKQILSKNSAISKTITVKGGKVEHATLTAQSDFYVLNKKGEESTVAVQYDLKKSVAAPAKAGDVVGKATITKDGKVVG